MPNFLVNVIKDIMDFDMILNLHTNIFPRPFVEDKITTK